MQLRCPECCSEEAEPTARDGFNCGNCGVGFEYEAALVTVADAEAYAVERIASAYDHLYAPPQLFAQAEEMIGARVRDSHGREWVVESVGEKEGHPTLRGENYWDRPGEVKVLCGPDDHGCTAETSTSGSG